MAGHFHAGARSLAASPGQQSRPLAREAGGLSFVPSLSQSSWPAQPGLISIMASPRVQSRSIAQPPIAVAAQAMPPFRQFPAPARCAPPQRSLMNVDCWLRAAADFEMSSDFDLAASLSGRPALDLPSLMVLMKEQSAGKQTIQALGDKLTLHQILKNMGVPQMPALLALQTGDRNQVQRFVEEHLCRTDEGHIVKPTHLSNASGVLLLARPTADQVASAVDVIHSHVQRFLLEKAAINESAALRSLRPGFLGQPQYESVVGFKSPLELRVVVLWGKARLAVWWWGRPGDQSTTFSQRNSWLVRCPLQEGLLSPNDPWEAIHEHPGAEWNPGFKAALEMFRREIGRAAELAEAVATAVGAPFLRADFFVGSPRWGLRLNEVAYGCGVDYRNIGPATPSGKRSVVDDAPAIARILQDGMAACRNRRPPQHFLGKLGVKGHSYFDMSVMPMGSWCSQLVQQCHRASARPDGIAELTVPEELCKTMPPGSRQLRGPYGGA